MEVPSFGTVEQADAWLAQRASDARRDDWIEAHDRTMQADGCVRWVCEDGHTVVTYTKAKVGKTPRFVCVVRRSGRVIYIRGFAKRADAKERARTEYAKSSPRFARRNGL
jgi:hypothetical protein